MVKNPPAKQEMQVLSLGQEDHLKEEMTTHSNILAWEIPWTEEPGGLQSRRSQKVRQGLVMEHTHTTKIKEVYLLYWFQSAHQIVSVVCSVMSDSLGPHDLEPIRLLCPWDVPRQEYWSGLLYPSLGGLPDPGTELAFLVSPAQGGRFFTTVPPEKPSH